MPDSLNESDKEMKGMEALGSRVMLNIDQVSRLTGVRKSTLRYWEKTFNEFLNPNRTGSRRREYTFEDVAKIESIKKLLEEEHLTNQGVRLRLGNGSGRGATN